MPMIWTPESDEGRNQAWEGGGWRGGWRGWVVVAFEGEVGVWVVVVVVVRPCGCVHGRLVAGWLRTRGGGGGADRVGFWTEAGARGEVRVWESE